MLDNMRVVFLSSLDFVRMGDLVGTVALFKRLGRTEIATELIQAFVDSRRDAPDTLDPDNDPFAQLVEDPEILAAFQAARASTRVPQHVQEILGSAAGDIWSPDVVDRLATASVEEFRVAFKSKSGEPLRQALANALRFANVANATPAMQQVTEKVKAALQAIADESPLNALRVARLGIRVAPKADGIPKNDN